LAGTRFVNLYEIKYTIMKKITLLTTAICLAFAINSAKAQTTPPETNNPTSTGIRTGPTNTDPRPAQTNAPSQIKPDNGQSDSNPSGVSHNTGTNTSSAGGGRMTGTGSTIKTVKISRDTIVAKP
jgi:hypothetical protein